MADQLGHLLLCCTAFLSPGWRDSANEDLSFLGRGGARQESSWCGQSWPGRCRHQQTASFQDSQSHLSHSQPPHQPPCSVSARRMSKMSVSFTNKHWPISEAPHLRLRAGLSPVWKFELIRTVFCWEAAGLWSLHEAVKGLVCVPLWARLGNTHCHHHTPPCCLLSIEIESDQVTGPYCTYYVLRTTLNILEKCLTLSSFTTRKHKRKKYFYFIKKINKLETISNEWI